MFKVKIIPVLFRQVMHRHMYIPQVEMLLQQACQREGQPLWLIVGFVEV
ncbi:hypothetical protein GKIL_3770 [Gloeobacter kilaueensis JS1]|uniref:Uncharacterized protein n=1 Tax=Gloeobacter kilaueensis (strain ATCC BAA-2537 / CCAP 1431/1 / ULC 316 / JS1) TaxID=1183438 RepID=U5QM75_GLOK1|nr:hypothetical protein GKIL_3770 [Gloeobacter kilaueensis JS1]